MKIDIVITSLVIAIVCLIISIACLSYVLWLRLSGA